MSYSETITRTDLTNILNKVLPIRSETPCDTVTLPFTPTANGLMIVCIRNTSSARAYQSFTNTLPTLVDNYAVADGYWTQVVYVQSGKQVELSTQSNIKTVTYYYIPLDDIVSASLRTSDYIVEQGTSGIWTYRKWNSGIAECWGRHSFSVTAWAAWGSLWETNGTSATYPSNLFISAPTLSVTPAPFSNGDSVLSVEIYGNYATKERTTSLYLMRASQGSTGITGYIDIHAKGKWK